MRVRSVFVGTVRRIPYNGRLASLSLSSPLRLRVKVSWGFYCRDDLSWGWAGGAGLGFFQHKPEDDVAMYLERLFRTAFGRITVGRARSGRLDCFKPPSERPRRAVPLVRQEAAMFEDNNRRRRRRIGGLGERVDLQKTERQRASAD